MKIIESVNDNSNSHDIEEAKKVKETIVVSKNNNNRIIINTVGVVKFLDNSLGKKDNQSKEFANLIVMNASGIMKAFIYHKKRKPFFGNLSNEKNVDHNNSYEKREEKYKFPTIIQNKIDNFYKEEPCTEFLKNSFISNYLFVEGYRCQRVEMFNLKSLDLEMVFQKHDKIPLSMSSLENPIFSVSNFHRLLAHCSSEKCITIYLIENGLEIITKNFNDANRIISISFSNNDEKLFVETEDDDKTRSTNIWNIFTYKNELVGNPSNELEGFRLIDFQEGRFGDDRKEPWVNDKYKHISYLDNEKTTQIIIGKTTVQVWKDQVLEFIWANSDNEEIKPSSLNVRNCEFHLTLLSPSNTNIGNIHWPNRIHILKEACNAIEYLYKQKYKVRSSNQNKYDELVINTENLIKRHMKNMENMENLYMWRLSEIRYGIMGNLIRARRVSLLYQILFDNNVTNKVNIRVNHYLHIPRQCSWPEKKSN